MINTIKNLKYHIYTAKDGLSFEDSVRDVLKQINREETIFRLAFFACPSNNEEYLIYKKAIEEQVKGKFEKQVPPFSLIAQPPTDVTLYLEVQSYSPSKQDKISFHYLDNTPYILLENQDLRWLLAGGFQADVVNDSIEMQSEKVFKQLDAVLKKENFAINDIIRQWNYMEEITKQDKEGNQHYQLFNNSRTRFYSQTDWNNGYPAATGIGTDLGGILVEVDAVIPKNKEVVITPIDNKLQIAAHVYSDLVLENANDFKSTPKFERAKSIAIRDHKLIYISGTAAIRGEDSLTNVGLEKQLHITLENIAELIGDAELKLLRVYLKHSEDQEEAQRLIKTYNLSIPISYMYADVCRDELLIEIEGIAIN